MGFEAAFQRLEQRLNDLIDQSKVVTSTLAERHFRDSFTNSGFTDNSLQRWKPLKNARGYNPLIKTGQLRGSIRSQIIGNVIRISSDRDYSKFQNDGTQTIPARKFIGQSQKLNMSIRLQILSLAKRILI